ncbi:IclR family transcriptional regulator domain-containing protein [Rhabdothermincola salaria]|uniref:IclR family transcriptional regulator domain-containing protein n=1 Tax=Rhabdothermincola salaria TaxID=2903142 RepID=UPI001E44F9A2|nr:helix-turn-helix domain-containing protein [Rhabdothermincola salaria]
MKSVRTALRVFETVAAHQPVGLSELSRTLDVPKASVQRALRTLSDAGWLRHDVTRPGLWVVTARFSVLADADPAVITAREAARPRLDDLRRRLDAPTGLFVLDGDRMVILAGPEDPETLRALDETLGPLPVHLSAAGRAILARLPTETRDEIMARVLPTGADPDLAARVHDGMARVTADGYAVAAGEYQADLTVVAAPVVDAAGLPVAAVAAMAERLLDDDETATFGAAVVDAAAAVTRVLDSMPLGAPATTA